MKKTDLEIRLMAVNVLNKYAKNILDHEVNHFKKFIGQDILTVNMKFKKKFEHESLEEFKGFLEDGTHFSVTYYIECTKYSFRISIKSCVNGGNYENNTYFCQYFEDSFYPFNFKNEILVDNENEKSERINNVYNISELLNMAEEVKQIEKLYLDKVNKIPHVFQQVLDIRKLQY